MRKLNLCLHAGASRVERDQVIASATPTGTKTWSPIPHGDLLGGVQTALEQGGLTVVNEAHGLTKDGNRYFGLLQVVNGHQADDFGLVVGVRNSHDKKFPAGLVVGASVFVCDNLSFSGEIKLARKHTVHIRRDLPQLISRAVGLLGDLRNGQERRFGAYKTTELADGQVHDLIVRAMDAGVVPVTKIPAVLEEYRNPRHAEFKEGGRTAWRLFNAVTEIAKGNLDLLPRRTQVLHGLLDVAAGLVLSNGQPVATVGEPQIVAAV